MREHIFLQREKAESPQRFCGRKGWFYEKKRKRLTAFLLAALMMFSCMSVSAFAAEVPENSEEQTEQEVLQLVSMTSDTIVLRSKMDMNMAYRLKKRRNRMELGPGRTV